MEEEGRFSEEAGVSAHQSCALNLFHPEFGVERIYPLVCIKATWNIQGKSQ